METVAAHKTLTRNEIARVLHGTLQETYRMYELYSNLMLDDDLSVRVPASWIYPYRKIPGIMTIILTAIGGRSSVHHDVKYNGMRSEQICALINQHKADIITALKAREAREDAVKAEVILSKSIVTGVERIAEVSLIVQPAVTFEELNNNYEAEKPNCDPQEVLKLYSMLPTTLRSVNNCLTKVEQSVETNDVFDLAIYSPPNSGVCEYLDEHGVPYLHLDDLFLTRTHCPLLIGNHPCVVHLARKTIAILPTKSAFNCRMKLAGYDDSLPYYEAFKEKIRLASDVRQTDLMASQVLEVMLGVPWIR